MRDLQPEETIGLTKRKMMEWSVEDLEYEKERMRELPHTTGIDKIYYIKLCVVVHNTRKKLDNLFKN